MPDYELAIQVEGDGLDPNHRCHWSFILRKPGSNIGSVLQVQVISLQGLVYQFEEKLGQPLDNPNCEGRVFLSQVEAKDYQRVKQIISGEPAPRNNKVGSPKFPWLE